MARIMAANHLRTPSDIKEGQKLFIPGAKKVLTVEPSKPLTPVHKKELELSLESEEATLKPNKIEKRKTSLAWKGAGYNLAYPGEN